MIVLIFKRISNFMFIYYPIRVPATIKTIKIRFVTNGLYTVYIKKIVSRNVYNVNIAFNVVQLNKRILLLCKM